MKSFYEWLMEQTSRDDVVGDLARDAQRDPNAIKGWSNYQKWHDHVGVRSHHNRAVMEALQEAWQEYDPAAELPDLDEEEEDE